MTCVFSDLTCQVESIDWSRLARVLFALGSVWWGMAPILTHAVPSAKGQLSLGDLG